MTFSCSVSARASRRRFRARFSSRFFLPHDTHPEAYAKDPGYLTVEYPDGSGGSIYCSHYEDEGHIMFNHCGGDAFFNDMYELARRTRSIIFWPDAEPFYLYTDESVRAEVKGIDYFEEGRSRLVRSGFEIGEAIRTS